MKRRTKTALASIKKNHLTWEQKMRSLTYHISKKLVRTQEYKRSVLDLAVYGQSTFDPEKAIKEMKELGSLFV